MEDRMTKDMYYLNIAEAVSKRSTCLSKNYGAVIVKDDIIMATGYNGAPRGRANCNVCGFCIREGKELQHGEDYALSCRSVHAEMNAIIFASQADMVDSTMYLFGYDKKRGHLVKGIDSCPLCKRLIINAGINKVCFADCDARDPFSGDEYGVREVPVRHWVDNDASFKTV